MDMENTKSSTSSFLVIIVLGGLLSLTLATIATWADLEAAFYGFSRRATTPLQNLRCPILLNRNETGIVSVRISNTTDRKLSPSVRAEFSSRLTEISTLESIELPQGESKTREWVIGPENIDLQRFIFSKVLVFASYPIPDREATCGTFIIDLPIPGSILTWMIIVLGWGGMGGGLLGLNRSKPLSGRLEKSLRPLTFLGILITVTTLVSLFGWWVQAILLLSVTLIAIVIIVSHVFLR